MQLITGLILTPVVAEFRFNGPLLTLAANIGLLVGAVFWSLGSDIWGRRSVSTVAFDTHFPDEFLFPDGPSALRY